MAYRILIVDDDIELLKMLKNYFEIKRYDVMMAEDGTDALEKIHKKPDIILLDINMPKIDGLEVALLDPESHQKVWGKILEEVNISEWMPGDNWSVDEHKYQIAPPTYHIRKNISIDAPIAKGKYILALTVLDPAGMQPSLRFANENYFEGGYHPMGYIGIGESVADTRLNPDLFFDIQSDKSLKYQFKQPDK